MKVLLKNNLLVFALYTVIILIISFFLLNYGKVQIHVFLNQLVGNKILDRFFYYITYLGDGGLAPVLLICVLFYNIRLGVCCTFSFLIAALVTAILKNYFFDDVMRPWHVFQWHVSTPLKYVDTDSLYIHRSFPSGHATQAFAVFTCLVLFARKYSYKLIFFSLAILAAFSRVYLSQHWLVDVTAGSMVGLISAIILFYLLIDKNKFGKLNRPLLKKSISE
jgi:membrane-associated phospholipid phosphatase